MCLIRAAAQAELEKLEQQRNDKRQQAAEAHEAMNKAAVLLACKLSSF